MREGNLQLRRMSSTKARSICRSLLRSNPSLEQRYKDWVDIYNDEVKTYNAAFRAFEKSGPRPVRQ